MSTEEPKQRNRENARKNILDAALKIAQQDGWKSLSIRGIARLVDYSYPLIYQHFDSKKAILAELKTKGFTILLQSLRASISKNSMPSDKSVENIASAYLKFTFSDRTLFLLMFGVTTECIDITWGDWEKPLITHFKSAIIRSFSLSCIPEPKAEILSYLCWSMTHGLASLSVLNEEITYDTGQLILEDAIKILIHKNYKKQD